MNLNRKLEYKKLSTNTDLSSTGLQQAVLMIGPAFVYELFIHPDALMETRNKLFDLNIDPHEAGKHHRGYDDNPLRPYINLHVNETLGRFEWVLGAKDILAGSPGVAI